MSEQSCYETLGVSENASFDEVQEARNRLIQQYRGDQKRVEMIEAAYDAILMDRLKMRQEGKIKVPERIRFAEKTESAPSTLPTVPINTSFNWLQRLIDRPSLPEVLWPVGVFSVLSGLVIYYPTNDQSKLPLLMAFGVGFSLYWLNRKERQFGRAMLLTLIGLFVGVGLATGLGSILSTQVNTINLSPDTFATLITFVILWIISSFLR